MKRLICIMLLMVMFSIQMAAPVFAETAIKTERSYDGGIIVTTYSTEKQTESEVYSLYTVKKKDGRWVKDAYMRSIEMPAADTPINGKKYKYKSSKKEEIEWMKKRTVYRLFPEDKGNRSSVPFWRNPLR